MKKIGILLLIFCFMKTNIYCQLDNNSVLTNDAYIENPKQYLLKLDSTKIQSKILIDRAHFDELLLNINGTDKVTSINCSDWVNIYEPAPTTHRLPC